MFNAIRLLNKKTFENPEVEDSEGKLATRPGDILDTISKYFKDKFVDSNQDVKPVTTIPWSSKTTEEKNNSRRG